MVDGCLLIDGDGCRCIVGNDHNRRATMLEQYEFKCAFARRIPDPNFQKSHRMETYSFLMRCRDLPSKIGNEPNARDTNIRRLTYQQVGKSLLEEDGSDEGTFHLKNKGITIIADSVKQNGDSAFIVKMDTGQHGIVDGGHTYALIQENKEQVPENQYVRVDVRVGVPTDWIPMISGGLNTAVQVQAMSLEDLKSSFDWIKKVLGPLDDRIAWSENSQNKYMDARDLISIMCLLNPVVYPNEKSQQPINAYRSKEAALQRFKESSAEFEAMNSILMDVLKLHDHIAFTAKDVWNSAPQPTNAGSMKIFESKKKGKFDFPFIGKKAEQRLAKPALYPILGAFRRFVRRNEITGDIEWITDFPTVLEFWKLNGRDMLVLTHETLKDLGYTLTSLGKNINLWTTLHSTTGMKIYEQNLMK